ncbi:hypothetical protein J437_LFUL005053 [Ladona fulva]|uniref:Large ribosomal subunit protein bL32m n=1 Tax=Ladona fulva TaxID=123851 RepID=A0A8K0KP71_LADFU|nr:hypothetical protein J437_LFUL005053 [Ladona fulva]
MAVMLRNVSRLLYDSFYTISNSIFYSLYGIEPRVAVVVNGQCNNFDLNNAPSTVPEDIFKTDILWAVPKSRRTIEKRLKRKFGDPFYKPKTLQLQTNIRICDTCGHYHEDKVLCPHCYAKIKKETEDIQAAIQAELGLSPVDKSVVVLYQGDREEYPADHWKGKRIVEMKKPRPAWFSKNLLQKSVESISSSSPANSDVKPTDLG